MLRAGLCSFAVAVYLGAVVSRVGAGGQLPDTFFDESSAPAIAYATEQPHDPVAQLNEKLESGAVALAYDPRHGYLRSVVDALRVPVESQLAVFSKTSVQAPIISPENPRTLFFNDDVVVGWPRGGFIEAASLDPQLGVIFYSLDQRMSSAPRFQRGRSCTSCHESLEATLGIPGMMLRSQPTLRDGRAQPQLGRDVVDHRLPISRRWGGWFVTGRDVSLPSLGNIMLTGPVEADSIVEPKTISLSSLEGTLSTDGYLSPYSDVVALLVFDHQMHMTNLLARMSWEARAAEGRGDSASLIGSVAREVADYMLFIDESPLPGRVEGSSGFTERFSAQGPRDSRGRSLRQFDLASRLLRFRCSYMIYDETFDALPPAARDAIYRRMWAILSGSEQGPRYGRFPADERRAVIEILRETKRGLPPYFTLPG